MLKAFVVRKSEAIKGHNIATLAQDANFTRRLKPTVQQRVDAAISEPAPVWKNLYRYSSTADLDRMGKENRIRFEVGGKLVRYADLPGDRMAFWAERLYNLAALIVQEGKAILWRSKRT